MRSDLVVRAGRAVVEDSEQACAVVVRAGAIAEVLPLDAPVAADAELRLADDEVLLPGLVDTHVHVDEPGRTEWEGFATATAAAAAGGVTTIVDMPLNSVPPTVDVAALEAKRKAALEQCHVDVGFWGGAVPGNTDDLADLHAAGVFGVKCFLLDSGVEEFPPLDAAGLREAMGAVAAFGGLLLVHAEDADVVGRAPAAQGRQYDGFLASRPREAEDAAVRVVLEGARATGARVHLVHLASAGALRMVASARADGVPVSVETCPHYLALTADDVPDGGTEFKCCPPIRDAANRDGLWRGLAEDVVDIVVSDHSPCPPELKSPGTGDFGDAWGGIASLQLALPVMWTEARSRGRTLVDLVRWMASGPAAVAGLPHKGRIAIGADADLVVFAPEQTAIVDPARLLQRHPVTPYAGRALVGVVRRTLLRGRPTGGEPRGRLLRRGEV